MAFALKDRIKGYLKLLEENGTNTSVGVTAAGLADMIDGLELPSSASDLDVARLKAMQANLELYRSMGKGKVFPRGNMKVIAEAALAKAGSGSGSTSGSSSSSTTSSTTGSTSSSTAS